MNKLTALDKLRSSLASTYKSTFFDNEIEDIDDETREFVSRNEEIFFTEFKKSSISIFQQCKALSEINIALKKDGVFTEWCKHVHLTKDKTSELLKRWELYQKFPEKHLWVSSLSILAVKTLTNKGIEQKQLDDMAELELRSLEEIKEYISVFCPTEQKEEKIEIIDSFDEDVENEFKEFKELKNKIKELKSSKDIKQYKTQIKSVRRELEELEALLLEQEESNVNQNNLNLFEDGLR